MYLSDTRIYYTLLQLLSADNECKCQIFFNIPSFSSVLLYIIYMVDGKSCEYLLVGNSDSN